jgi:Ni,Fe-hydrogenase III large subunit
MTSEIALAVADLVPCRPWPRQVLTQDEWSALVHAVPNAPLVLLAVWADTVQVHALLLDEAAAEIIAVSTPVENGRYPAVSAALPHAASFERMIRDLWGHVAEGARDTRPWLDHGHWPQSKPMAGRPDGPRPPNWADALAEPDEPLMQLPLGPIHGRLEEAVRLRLMVRDGTIVSAEAQLGFTHKGTLMLMRGKSPRTAARFAARLSGDATVAHSFAFAVAAEAALGAEPPDRAVALRTVMLEIERIACHLDNLAEIGRLAEANGVWTRCGVLREHLLRATAGAFGHRLMMDCVVPGGVALDIADAGTELILRALGHIASALPTLRQWHDGTVLANRLSGLGRIGLPLLRLCGAGGPVGRSSGRLFDARMLAGDRSFRPSVVRAGDALGRQHMRIDDIAASLDLIGSALRGLPAGPLTVALPQESGEGIGCAESARGDIWHWLRLDHGQIAACFPRDPGWALWPVAEAVLINAAVEDADLIRASLALPASGMDL